MPSWAVSLAVGILGALVGALAVIASKWLEIRFLRGRKAHEREAVFLAEIREHAGGIKERLLDYTPRESILGEYCERMQRLDELRGLLAYHSDLVYPIISFYRSAGVIAQFADDLHDWGQELELRKRLAKDFEDLAAKIAKLL